MLKIFIELLMFNECFIKYDINAFIKDEKV